MNRKRSIAASLALALLLSVAACMKTDTPEPTPETSSLNGGEALNCAYISKDTGVDLAASNYTFAYSKGRVYYSSVADIRGSDGEITSRKAEIFSANTDGGDEKSVWSRELVFELDPANKTETIESLSYLNVDQNGNIWIALSTEIYAGSQSERELSGFSTRLQKLDSNGEPLFELELSEAMEGYSFRGAEFDDKGNIYLWGYLDDAYAVFVLDGNTGEYMFSSRETSVIVAMSVTNDGDVAYAMFDSSGYAVVVMDAATKSSYTAAAMNVSKPVAGMYRGYGEYDLLLYRSGNVYGYDLESGNESRIISFADSQIQVDNNAAIKIVNVSETEFLMSQIKWSDGSAKLYKLTYDSGAEARVQEMTTVTLGVFDAKYLDVTERLVNKFNVLSKSTRVEIMDYTKYNTSEDITGAMVRFDTDLIQGSAPDIIGLTGISPTKYIKKGVLADLNEMLDNDPDVNRDDLWKSALEACSSDGKLYHIMSFYMVATMAGKTSLFGDGSDFSVQKVKEVLADNPGAELAPLYRASKWITDCVSANIDDFIDWESGTCNFDNEGFVSFLESAKNMPTELDTSFFADKDALAEFSAEYKKGFRENRSLLYEVDLTYPRAARNLAELFGEDFTFVGYPALDSSSSTLTIWPVCDYGINAASEKKEAAWEFFSFVLTDYSIFENSLGGMSINKAEFNARARFEMTPVVDRFDSSSAIVLYEGQYPLYSYDIFTSPKDEGIERYADFHLTEDEVEKVRQALEAPAKILGYEPQVLTIISEETDMFLKGIRNAGETAQIIQSRVSIYVAENS